MEAFRSELSYSQDELLSDNSILLTQIFDIVPSNSVRDSHGLLEFIIPPTNQYIDLNKSVLQLKLKIVQSDDTNLRANEVISPANNFLHSLFANLEIYLSGVLIEDYSNNYHMCAYIQNLLDSHLNKANSSILLLPDNEPNSTTGDGFKARNEYIKSSALIELCGPLVSSCWKAPRYIPSGCEVRIRLRRSAPEFCLISNINNKPNKTGAPYKIMFEEAVLRVVKHTVSPSLISSHLALLSRGQKLVIPIRQPELKLVTVPKGNYSLISENLWNGKLPSVVYIACTDAEGLLGKLSKNPYYFAPHNISYLELFIDQDSPNRYVYQLDFDNSNYLWAYTQLRESICAEDETYLNRKLFKDGYTIFAFNLQPSSAPEARQAIRHGTVKLSIKFSKELSAPITVLCLGVTESQISFTKDGDVEVQRSVC